MFTFSRRPYISVSGIRLFRSVYRTRSRKLFDLNRKAARFIITGRVHALNEHYGLPIGKIAIRNQRSRWGSCSKKGNLNFNYKIIFLSQELRDYVIVHEICHIKEFNHGKSFWKLVEEKVPNYKVLRRELRGIK